MEQQSARYEPTGRSTAAQSETPRPTDTIRQAVVALSAVLAIIGAFVGSGAAGGVPIAEASGGALAADATLIAPGGPAFSIWSVIYVGLIAYAIWQFLPGQKADERQRRLGYWIAASLILNAGWILSVQFDLLGLSVPVIVLLLAVLAWTFVLLARSRPKNALEAVVADGTIGLYLGWVCVATAANISAVLVAADFDGFGVDPEVWAVLVLAVAGAIGIALALYGRGRLTPAVSLAWGLAWVGVARLTGDLVSIPTAIAAFIAAAAVVAVTLIARIRSPKSPE